MEKTEWLELFVLLKIDFLFYICEVIWSIRQRLAEYSLQKLKPVNNLEKKAKIADAKSVLVLFNFSDRSNFKLKEIREELSSIAPLAVFKGLSFCKSTKQVQAAEFASQVEILTPKNLNVNLKPKTLETLTADFVLDFRKEYDPITQYVLQSCGSSLKVGSQREWNKDFLDFMIQIKDEDNYKYLAHQIATYINMINSNNNAA